MSEKLKYVVDIKDSNGQRQEIIDCVRGGTKNVEIQSDQIIFWCKAHSLLYIKEMLKPFHVEAKEVGR